MARRFRGSSDGPGWFLVPSRFLPFRGPRDSPGQCVGNFPGIYAYTYVCLCVRVCVSL